MNQNGYLSSIFRTNKIQIKNWIVQLENQDLVNKTNYIYQMGEAESSCTFVDPAWKVPKYRSEKTPYLDIFPILCVQMKVLARKKQNNSSFAHFGIMSFFVLLECYSKYHTIASFYYWFFLFFMSLLTNPNVTNSHILAESNLYFKKLSRSNLESFLIPNLDVGEKL